MQESRPEIIVFFDGVCNLCNSFVDFVIQRETLGRIVFASLQSETAQKYLSKNDLQTLESVIVYDFQKQTSEKQSLAIFHVLSLMRFPWNFLSVVGRVIPRRLSDFLYHFIAENRYQWFGQRNSCRVPTESEKSRLWI